MVFYCDVDDILWIKIGKETNALKYITLSSDSADVL